MDPRAVNYHSDANSPGSITTDGTGCTATGCTDADDGLCRSAFCATAAACVSIFSGNSEGACAGADISSADIKVAQDNCEAAGIDASDTRHEHVCRYRPAQRELCPYTDSNGAHVSSCTCDGGGASSLFDEDECATEVYDGVSHDACDSAAFRLCSDFDGPGPDEGWPGRHCTAYRDSWSCPDDTNGFVCNDPNQYWLGDATCSCAYQDGRYSDAVSGTCGTGTVFVNSRTGQEDVTVTNYGMTLFLESDPTTRNHVCRLINQGPGSDCLRGSL